MLLPNDFINPTVLIAIFSSILFSLIRMGTQFIAEKPGYSTISQIISKNHKNELNLVLVVKSTASIEIVMKNYGTNAIIIYYITLYSNISITIDYLDILHLSIALVI
jgi:hypothetical protein